MPPDEAAVRDADGASRFDEVSLLEREELAPNDPRQPHPGEESQEDNHAHDRAALNREEDEQQEDGGKGEHDVDETHQRGVEPPAIVACKRADHDPDRRRDERSADTDE